MHGPLNVKFGKERSLDDRTYRASVDCHHCNFSRQNSKKRLQTRMLLD